MVAPRMLIYCCNSRAEALHNLRHSIRRGSPPHVSISDVWHVLYTQRHTHTRGGRCLSVADVRDVWNVGNLLSRSYGRDCAYLVRWQPPAQSI